MHGSMRRVREKFAEMEMNQHFRKTLATHFHVINTTQDSHTSNHNKASHIHQTTSITYIYIKPQASHTHIHQTTSFTYTSNHKLHIYIKPQASYTHIHQTTSISFIKGGQETNRSSQ